MFIHGGAAAPGDVTVLDTHWIRQDRQGLTKESLQIVDGTIGVPIKSGLGVALDYDHDWSRCTRHPSCQLLGAREDAAAMHFLVPDWTFDPKRPCLVR